ncbi:MAG TPA: FtsQ-type POTRA domain-containing protein, partial [Bryobacterales bacterium]|nr:FtsQ-type POTRA domain-containing protein [Bryobacterales bacterium]
SRDEFDAPEPSPYLRRSRRIEVRRPAVRWKRALLVGGAIFLVAGGTLSIVAFGVHTYLTTSPRFSLTDTLAVQGSAHVPRERLAQVFAADLGRSVFEVPLDRRRAELAALPWVQSAYVVRGWPNRLRVLVSEREPVAFARLGSGLGLIDRDGVLMPILGGAKFRFPVLSGASEGQPPAERRRRVGIMLAVLADLDREIPRRSGEVSEIDLTDPNDAAITVSQAGSAVLVHLGNTHFLDRYKLFLENVEAWRDEYGSVHSVDLRFEKQVIVKP